jgi:DnaJ-class molecular chaperone
VDRTSAYCLACKGEGVVVCTACEGSGISKKKDVGVGARRLIQDVATRVSRSIGHDVEVVRTNRCSMCHGHGTCTCPTCHGTGRRL